MILLLSLAAAANDDVNCNGILSGDEPLVSFTDPDCTYISADYYLQYSEHGCRYPALDYDTDGDGYIGAIITLPGTDITLTLTCDVCEGLYESSQTDSDGAVTAATRFSRRVTQ